MKYWHKIFTLYTVIIVMGISIGSYTRCMRMQPSQSATEGTLTLEEAEEHFYHYMMHLIHKYKLPHSGAQFDEDRRITLLELTKYATDNDGTMRVRRSILEKLEKEYRKRMKFLYPRHTESATIKEGLYTRKHAKDRLKAEILSTFTLGKTSDETKKVWKHIKKTYVYPKLYKKTFLEYVGELGIPVVTEKDINELIEETKAYVAKQQQKSNKKIKREKEAKTLPHSSARRKY